LQFQLVQKHPQTVSAKAIVEIGGEGFLAIRPAVVYEDIIYIVVAVGI
jgi:hypothetical protein